MKLRFLFFLGISLLIGTAQIRASTTIYHYTLSMIQSLEKLGDAEEHFYSFDYRKIKRHQFGEARKNILKAIRKVEQSKIDLNHYKNSKNPWILISIAYFHKGTDNLKEIYEKVLKLVEKKVNLPISLDRTAVNEEISQELEKISNAGRFLSEGANATTHALLDPKKQKATHLGIVRSEYRVLKKRLATHFKSSASVNQDYELADYSLLVIYQFLNQSWHTYGEKYNPSKAQLELFDDQKLRDVNQDSYWRHLEKQS